MNTERIALRQFLRIRDVVKVVSIKRSSILLAVKEGRFPKSVRLGLKAVGWDLEEIARWQQARIDERNAAAATE